MSEESPFFISVVIVNYNGAEFLERCLSALDAQTFREFEIILVDNASTDESCAFVEKNFPNVKLIRSERNVGFAAGNNLGIRAARGNGIATLNTDTQVEKEYLEKLCAPMVAAENAARVGACAPLMLEMERRKIVDAAGIVVDALGYAWNVGAGMETTKVVITDEGKETTKVVITDEGMETTKVVITDEGEETAKVVMADEGKETTKVVTTREVFGACAGAALYRKAMLDEIGLFDDDFFGFYEDADLAWRAHNAGWKTIFVPTARVYHTHGASFGKISPRKTYLLARNRWWTAFKNFRAPQFFFALPLLFLLDAISLVHAATRGHFQPAWQGRIDAWRGLKKMWAKRKSKIENRKSKFKSL